MPAAPAASLAADAPRPLIRLRSLLLIAALAAGGAWVKPRAAAAWRLHNVANKYADYAACMVGPTGPSLLRDNPSAYADLVRRRLITAPPEARPFAGCEKLAAEMHLPDPSVGLHGRAAQEFSEYGAPPPEAESALVSVAPLYLGTDALAELARDAWPFVRTGYTRLMKPSSHTHEAVHPVATPSPGVGSGLPARRARYRNVKRRGDAWVASFGAGANQLSYRSSDQGRTWTPTAVGEAEDGCLADAHGRSFAFSLDTAANRTVVMSLGPDTAPYAADLASGEDRVAAAACDARALVVALVGPEQASADPEHPTARLKVCPYHKPCVDLPGPQLGRRGLRYPLDVARVGGATVISTHAGGITRVTSSRDEGRSWVPPVVAFDAEGAQERTTARLAAPWRLLTLGERLVIYGGARSAGSYYQLVSEDQGASFHAPGFRAR